MMAPRITEVLDNKVFTHCPNCGVEHKSFSHDSLTIAFIHERLPQPIFAKFCKTCAELGKKSNLVERKKIAKHSVDNMAAWLDGGVFSQAVQA